MIDVTSKNLNIQLSTKENINACLSGGHLQVILDKSAKMETVKAVTYIKSGRAEIIAAVEQGKVDFNAHTIDKTNSFNNNAYEKTSEFNNNAAIKKAEIDIDADIAKRWAIGEPSEPEGYSAKHWANEASVISANLANKDLSNLSALGEARFEAKQDIISDLSTIRSGAALGSTALQPSDVEAFTAVEVQTIWESV